MTRRRVVVFLLLAVAIYGLFVAFTLNGARNDIERARQSIEGIRSSVELDTALETDLAPFDEAMSSMRSARRRLSNPLLAPLRPLPFVGRQLASARDLVATAESIAGPAIDALHELQELPTDVPLGERARGISRAAGSAVEVLARNIDSVDLGPNEGLLKPLTLARADLAGYVEDLNASLPDIRVALAAIDDLMTGKRTYLVLAGNNAEMAAGAPIPLTSGLLTIDDGNVSVGDWLWLDDPTFVSRSVDPGTGPLGSLWSFVSPGTGLREITQSPTFALNAEVAARQYEATTGLVVDGVLLLDAESLVALAMLSDTNVIEGETLSRDRLRQHIFHDQYVPLGDALAGEATDGRRDALLELAERTVAKLVNSPGALPSVAREFRFLAENRHVMWWSKQPSVQRAAEIVGGDGRLTDNQLLVTLNNRGANKLDWFVDLEAIATRTEGTETDVIEIAVTATNRSPIDGEPRYVIGPNSLDVSERGEYIGYLTLHAPRTASKVSLEGPGPLVVDGNDDGHRVVGRLVSMKTGETWRGVWRFVVPHGAPLEPSPHARPNEVGWAENTV